MLSLTLPQPLNIPGSLQQRLLLAEAALKARLS